MAAIDLNTGTKQKPLKMSQRTMSLIARSWTMHLRQFLFFVLCTTTCAIAAEVKAAGTVYAMSRPCFSMPLNASPIPRRLSSDLNSCHFCSWSSFVFYALIFVSTVSTSVFYVSAEPRRLKSVVVVCVSLRVDLYGASSSGFACLIGLFVALPF